MMKRLSAFTHGFSRFALPTVAAFTLLLTPSLAHANVLGAIGSAVGQAFETFAIAPAMTPFLVASYIAFMISNFMLWIAGVLFNLVIVLTVFQFATFFGNTDGIHAAWTVLRDVGNIVLLFGFIFMGLGTVLNLHEYTIKKALPGFIIFAVLLNFSLFATQAVIDVANVLSSSIYAQAITDGGGCTNAEEGSLCINDGISGKVMQVAGLSSVFHTASFNLNSLGDYFDDPLQTIMHMTGLAVFSALAATVLFAGAIMFIIRAAVLVFLMALSPIGFAGMAVPPLQKLAHDWWNQLLKQAFFAPIYLLLVLVALKVAEGLSTNVGEGGGLSGALASGNASAMSMLLVYGLVLGFMSFALVGANKLGAAGAGFATKTAGGVALGSVGFVGRRTVGRVSNRLAKDVAAGKGIGRIGLINPQKNPNLSRMAYGALNKGATASWSARSGLGGALKGAGVDLGKPNKAAAHGFHGIEEKMVKDREDYYKKVKATEKQKGVATEFEQELKDVKNKRENRLKGQMEAIEEQRKKVKEARLKNDEALLERERAELERRITEYDRLNGQDIKNEKGEVIARGDEEGKKLATRQKQLESRVKEWTSKAEAEKTKEYTAGLDRSSHNPVNIVLGIEKHADHEAADKIRKNQGKSEMDRALEKIKNEYEKKDRGDSGDGDHAPAAPSAPPSGGSKPAGGHGPDPHHPA